MFVQVLLNLFHYIVFIVAVWVIGLTVALSVGVIGGVFAQVLTVYGTSQAVNLFYYGQIFDIIGVMILLPIAIMCLSNIHRNIYWKILCAFMLISFYFFHANGLYLYALFGNFKTKIYLKLSYYFYSLKSFFRFPLTIFSWFDRKGLSFGRGTRRWMRRSNS